MTNNKSYSSFGVANIMTVCRMVLTPLFVLLLLKNEFTLALFAFALAGISDGLDGFIARCFNQRTVLGAYLDPVADKFLLLSAFICLTTLRVIPYWLTVIVVSREILIVFGILILIVTGSCYKVRPSFLSKCNTMIQIVIVSESLLILVQPGFNKFHSCLCWSTAVLSFLSGLQYIFIWWRILDLGVDT